MSASSHKFTPADIGQSKIKFQITGDNYCHNLQANAGDPGQILTLTFNGTQTFNQKGQPSDSDNDK